MSPTDLLLFCHPERRREAPESKDLNHRELVTKVTARLMSLKRPGYATARTAFRSDAGNVIVANNSSGYRWSSPDSSMTRISPC